jgi:rhodanese-related sulfurtransferase
MRPRPARIETINPPRAADRFFGGEISLVDVRSGREHRAVHIPGAAHIPLQQLRRRLFCSSIIAAASGHRFTSRQSSPKERKRRQCPLLAYCSSLLRGELSPGPQGR